MTTQQLKPIDYSDIIDDAIIDERNEQILQIRSDMKEVNEIFKLLGTHIDSQADSVNMIETHVTNAHVNTKEGLEEIKQADKESEKNNVLYLYIVGGIAGTITIGGLIIGSIFLL